MARSSRWKDASSQAQPAAPVPDATAHPMPPAAQVPAPAAPVGATPAPPFAPPAPPAPVAAAKPVVNPFAPPAPPDPVVTEQPAPAVSSSAAPDPAVLQPPVAGSTAVSPVEGDVAELRSTLHQLQATVATLVERAQEPTVPLGTSDTDQASRIIVMANRAAESTLEEARAEAAEILAAAQAHSVEIISTARELADQELAAERVRVAAATEAWTARRAEISVHLRDLESALTGYRDGLGETADAIREAAARLEDERADPPVIDELPAPDPAAFVTNQLPPESETVIDLTESSSPPSDLTDELAGSPRTSLFGGAASDEPAGAGPAPEATDAAPSEPELEPVPADAAPIDAPTDAVPTEPPARNLRPGLFGR